MVTPGGFDAVVDGATPSAVVVGAVASVVVVGQRVIAIGAWDRLDTRVATSVVDNGELPLGGPLTDLVGRVGVVINGTARVNYPAQARVRNAHGLTLYIHVEPDQEGVVLANGDSVLLVKQISGTRFLAIANPRPEVL